MKRANFDRTGKLPSNHRLQIMLALAAASWLLALLIIKLLF